MENQQYKTNLSIIVAMTENNVIGLDGRLPWHIPEDLQHFRKITKGNTVIMGRNTYESIGKPLPKRNNIVISSTLQEQPGLIICRTLEESLEKANELKAEQFIIGGAKLYQQTLPIANRLLISYVDKNYSGDIYFPKIDFADWDKIREERFSEFLFAEYQRKN